jgi:hypothetical protein
MSAWMHSKENFDDVAKTISAQLYKSDYNKKRFGQESVNIISKTIDMPAELYGKFKTPEDRQEWYIERFCEALHKANQESVNYRYDDSLNETYKCKIATAKGRTLSLVELVKRLHSIDYQSCEVSNWEEKPTAKMLHAITALLENVIVTSSQEYNDAKTWG